MKLQQILLASALLLIANADGEIEQNANAMIDSAANAETEIDRAKKSANEVSFRDFACIY